MIDGDTVHRERRPPSPPEHANGAPSEHRRSPGDASHLMPATANVDGAMLQALLTRPLQRVEDLALTVGISLRTAYRHVDRLQGCGLVDTLVPGSLGRASCQVAYLTRVGVRTLAGGDAGAARRLARAWGTDLRGLARLLPHLPARITLEQVLPSLLLACRRSAASPGCSERQMSAGAPLLRWRWALDYHHAFAYRERRRHLAVDAVLAVCIGGPKCPKAAGSHASAEPHRSFDDPADGAAPWYAAWVFLDPGVANALALVPRLAALIAYRESSARWPLYDRFPHVLILTASPRRADVWRQAAHEAALRLRADPPAGVIQVAPPGSASCWPLSVPGLPLSRDVPEPAASWIDLATGVPATLAALFATPLPEAALPPGLAALPLAPLALVDADAGDADPDGEAPVRATMLCLVPNVATASPGHARPAARHAGQRPDELSRRLTAARTTGVPGALDSDRRARLRASLALTLARREQTVLDLLAHHPLACQDDLAAWMEVAPDWIDRLRRRLRRTGLVQIFRVPRSALLAPRPGGDYAAFDASARSVEHPAWTRTDDTYLLRLTPLAWNFLAAVYRLPARQLAGGAPQARASAIGSDPNPGVARPREPARRPGKALHQANTYRFFTLLLRDAADRATGERQERLLWWETGAACVRRYRCMGRWGTLRPDAAGEYQSGGRRVRFWLEWDSGSMELNSLREKLERYAMYAQTGTWRMEDAHSLPVLLIVTPDVAQEGRVARLVDELRQRARLQWPGPLLIRVTTATRLERAGPLAAIWLPLLPVEPAPADGDEAEALVPTPSARLIAPLANVPPAPRRSNSPQARPTSPRAPTGGGRHADSGSTEHEGVSPQTAEGAAR
jgi:hypothetical protein